MSEEQLELLQCARYDEKEDMEAFLKLPEVKVNFQNEDGNTALHMAAANNHVEILKSLIGHKADVSLF